MRRRIVALVGLTLAGFAFAAIAGRARAEEAPPLAVIVHHDRRAEVTISDLAQIYLRRRRFWSDGAPIVPLNLPAGTALRVAFSRAVLRDDDEHLAEYWNRQYFYGTLPPATLASPAAVVRFVASDRNAIGYVPLADVDASVGVVLQIK